MKYEKFIFLGYELDRKTGRVDFFYSLDNKINFTERIVFNANEIDWNDIEDDLLNNALFNIHLVLGISYWKTYCPKNIIIQSGSLNKEQAVFWNNLYAKGLGEFFYKNKIDFRGIINFPYDNVVNRPIKFNFKDRSVVPFGGGKDSIVTAEMLKEKGKDFILMSLGDSEVQADVAKLIGKKSMVVFRELDSNLFELNKKGCFNGHIPITAVYSFIAVLIAVLYNYKNIILSNERSASYGNVEYLGENINHQYSKSFEFENLFSDYLNKYISPDLRYFSLLRSFSELQIMKIFSNYKKYLKVFSSCNRNFQINKEERISGRWCCTCPKCAFVFSQLAPFLSKKELLEVFGENLYNNKDMIDTYLELLGRKNIKPFECVGTFEEVLASICLVKEKGEFEDDFVIKNIDINREECKKVIGSVINVQGKNNIPNNFL